MNIAYLGWGSLVWNPKALPIQRQWFQDGPFARVEFTRQSNNGRITLVLDKQAEPVRVLWARSTLSDLDKAQMELKIREGITGEEWKSRIGGWSSGDATPDCIPSLPIWAQTHGIDVVVWTALKPRYKKPNATDYTWKRPTIDWVLDYLRRLTGTARDHAETYIRCAPRQIDTEYRRRIEAELGWTWREC